MEHCEKEGLYVIIRNPEQAVKRAPIIKHLPFQKADVYLDFIGILDKNFVKVSNTAQISEYVRNMMKRKLLVLRQDKGYYA